MKTKITVNKSFKLKVYGTETKFETLRWCAYNYKKLTNAFIQHLYFNGNKTYSTEGLGGMGNQAQHKAKGIVRAKHAQEKTQPEIKKQIPVLKDLCMFGYIDKQNSSSHFNYKLRFSNSFADEQGRPIYVFTKGTSPLKKALKEGFELSKYCEFYFEPKDNHWYVRVFTSKEVLVATPKTKSIGIDVGIRQIISTSEGFLGNSLSKRLKKIMKRNSSKQRQLSLAKNRKDEKLVEQLSKSLKKNNQVKKSEIKQLLDKEAKRVIARGLQTSSNLVVEDPRVLANLKGNKSLVRWARTYFAYRLEVLGKEKGVFVVFTHPAYTSQTCPKCDHKDRENREGLKFRCVKCGHTDHADINGAKNLARKGQVSVDQFIKPSIVKRLKAVPVSPL